MAKINIVLADSDELYLNKLTDYFMEKTAMFEVSSFTSRDSLIAYMLEKNIKIDVIVFAESMANELIANAEIPAKIFLSDGTYSDVVGFDSVNKYQKAEKLVHSIQMIYAEQTGHVEVVTGGDKQTKAIGVFSPVGGCGKTTMALALSMYLASHGKRVFYLNYEIINSTTEFLNTAPGGSLSDVLLAMKTKGANIGLRIVSNKYFDAGMNISFINPPESALEVNELTTPEQIKLIKELENIGDFDAIIIDFDSGFSEAKLELLDACDFILTPFTTDEVSLVKMRLFMREFGMRGELDVIFKKMSLAVNKADLHTNSRLHGSGIQESKAVEVTMPLSPSFADIRSLSSAVVIMHPVFAEFFTKVFR